MITKSIDPKNVRMYKQPSSEWIIKDGEKQLGYVAPVIASLNRLTGSWCYKIDGETKVVWYAGHSMREAATRMIKKLGYKI